MGFGSHKDPGDEDEEGYVLFDPKEEDKDIEGVYGEVEVDTIYVNTEIGGVSPVSGHDRKGEESHTKGEELRKEEEELGKVDDSKKGLYVNDLNGFSKDLKHQMEMNRGDGNKKHNPYVNDIFRLVEEAQRKEGAVGGGVTVVDKNSSASARDLSYDSRNHGNFLTNLLPAV